MAKGQWKEIAFCPHDKTYILYGLYEDDWFTDPVVEIGYYDEDNVGWVINNGLDFFYPTHWMELPEPPVDAKKEEKEK